ncbi:MAG: ABC transporter substrate-binding protein [Cohaesibacter sp.]|nr:ABC transporter substrate-binding protein [Cohaesibacter sp.]
MSRLSNIAMAALASTTMLAAAQISHAADELNVAYYSAPLSADPYQGGGVPTSALGFNVYEGLFFNDGYTNLKPGLAESYEWLASNILQLNLRKGVKFHDGKPFTSRDVVYSLCRMMFARDGKLGIIGGSLRPIKDIKVLDDHTVQLITKEPYPYLRAKLFYTYVMPAHLADAPGEITWDLDNKCGVKSFASRAEIDNLDKAVGTGPYKLTGYKKGTGDAVLEGFNDYWGGAPNWKKVKVHAVSSSGARLAGLMAGDFDVIENPTTDEIKVLQKADDFMVTSAPSLRPIYLRITFGDAQADITGTNGKNPFEDKNVRLAVAHAIDRAAIVKRIMGGNATAANQISPRYMPGALEGAEDIAYDPEKAKDLLAKAGYPNGFGMTLYGTNDRYINDARVVQAIGQYLTRIGIKTKVEVMGKGIFNKRVRAKDMQVMLYGYGHTQGALIAVQRTLATPNKETGAGQRNRSNYSNAELDKLITAQLTGDEDKIAPFEKKALEFVRQEMPVIPLYYQHYTIAHKKGMSITERGDERLLFQNVHPAAK